MGWGIAELAIMINTVAICMYLLRLHCFTLTDILPDAYCNDCFPKQQGEISALINLARILGGM